MKLGEVREHPDAQQFLMDLAAAVDRARDRVLNETRNGEHDAAMQAVGRHDALKELLDQLRK